MNIKALDHLVITTARLTSCLEFYQACGFQLRSTPGRHELFAGGIKINVHELGRELEPHAGAVQPGSADFCFEIAGDLAQVKEQLEEQGLQVELDIVPRTGVKGPMRSIYLRDPDGNLVEFCSYQLA